MKKRFAFIGIVFSLTLLLSGCGSQAGESSDISSSESSIAEEAPIDFSYSDGLDENGFWEGVTALDHVDLFEYERLSIDNNVHTITVDQVEAQKDTIIQNSSVSEQITDRAVADGDTVNIDYVGSIDGVEFEGGSTNGYGTDVTIGVTNYIDNFLDQIIGHTPGETFDVEVTFPDDYQQTDLQGKAAVFVTTVNYVVETTEPELTDDFVAENYSDSNGWSTVADLEAGLRDNLQNSAITQYLQEELRTLATINSTPESMVTYQQNSMIKYYRDYAERYNMEYTEYLQANLEVSSTEELLAAYADTLQEAAEYFLVIQAIAEDADLRVTDDDLTAYFLKQYGREDYSSYEEEHGLPYLKQIVLTDMVLDYIIEHAVLA